MRLFTPWKWELLRQPLLSDAELQERRRMGRMTPSEKRAALFGALLLLFPFFAIYAVVLSGIAVSVIISRI